MTRGEAAEVPSGFPGGPPVFLPTRRVDVSSTEVRARLKSALEQRSEADPEGFRVAGQDVDAAARVLRGYRQRLHAPNDWGLSLWSARDSQLARGDGPTGSPFCQTRSAITSAVPSSHGMLRSVSASGRSTSAAATMSPR